MEKELETIINRAAVPILAKLQDLPLELLAEALQSVGFRLKPEGGLKKPPPQVQDSFRYA